MAHFNPVEFKYITYNLEIASPELEITSKIDFLIVNCSTNVKFEDPTARR